jgi:hypothetical protein
MESISDVMHLDIIKFTVDCRQSVGDDYVLLLLLPLLLLHLPLPVSNDYGKVRMDYRLKMNYCHCFHYGGHDGLLLMIRTAPMRK